MSCIRVMLWMAMVAQVLVPTALRAQVPDHLKCYKIKDSVKKATYTADLGGLVPEPGCEVKLPGKLLCVATAKTNVNPTPPGAPDGSPAGAFVCYKTKCPKAATPVVTVTDQFGTRTVTPSTAQLLCAPVLPATPPTTTTNPSASTTTMSTATSTTTTTISPPRCCSLNAGVHGLLCHWTDPTGNCGTYFLGPVGTVCSSGQCMAAETPGGCCQTSYIGCVTGPYAVSQCTIPTTQGGFGGQLFGNAVCRPDGCHPCDAMGNCS